MEVDLALLAAQQVACDRKPQAGAAGVAVARGFQAVKGLEYLFQLGFREAGAVVTDADLYHLGRGGDLNLDRATELRPVLDQIPQRAANGSRACEHGHTDATAEAYLPTHVERVFAQGLEQAVDIDRLRGGGVVQAARIDQAFLDQRLHAVEVGLDTSAQWLVIEQFRAQA